MLLTVKRHEILADTGLEVPYAGRLFYDLSAWRDEHTSLAGRITTELAYVGIVLVSLIESAVRIPIAVLSVAFSKDSSLWFKGLNLCILTGIFSLYALAINFFVQNVSNYLVDFDLGLRFPLKDHFLFEACEAGRRDLAEKLLKKDGVNPHHVFEVGVSSSLVPRLLGHTKLNSLFQLNDYEKDYLELKLLSHWLDLKGDVELHGEKLKLEGAPSRWLFESLATSLDEFKEWDDFKNLELGEENATLLQETLKSAYTEHSYEKISKTVQDKKLCFVGSGWKQHGICLAFHGNYMAISNRGEGASEYSTLDVYKIDPSLVTADIIEEIFMHETLDALTGKKYFYKTLPAKLSNTGRAEKDALCKAFAAIAPKHSKGGTCALASKKSALRFAWAMLISDAPSAATLKRSELETKLFSDWAAAKALNSVGPEKFTGLKSKEMVLAQAFAKAKPKLQRLRWNRWQAWASLTSF